MFIPLSEVPTMSMGSGEERQYFFFHERDPQLPVEVVITRLPPFFDAGKNWHNHDFVEEFSAPLSGEVKIREKGDGKSEHVKNLTNAILRKDEWVVGITCESDKEVTLFLDSVAGNRRQVVVTFSPQNSEGKNLHRVENPTDEMVTMVTLKRVAKKILKKDPLIFRVDRNPAMVDR